MRQIDIFGKAQWISATPEFISASPVFRKSFRAKAGEKAVIRILGLGTYEAFLNGKRISEDMFLPLNSDYEAGCDPKGEILTHHRIWVDEFDISHLIVDGKNTLAVLLGDGWYTNEYYRVRDPFGEKKLCFNISIEGEDGTREIISDTDTKWAVSFAKMTRLHRGEAHDYTGWSDDMLTPDWDDSTWETCRISKAVDSDYALRDCPADRIQARLPATLVCEKDGVRIYDSGINLSGCPVLISGEGGGNVKIAFSEELTPSGDALAEKHAHKQSLEFTADRGGIEMYPRFTWLGFRYFSVEGNAIPSEVRHIHCDVEISSSFDSDNPTLNWIYHTFLNTQLSNMHRGIPSDCPHIERLGYTGDGQVCCRSVMHTLDAKEFYRKWIKDISDCQDTLSGHVQYTAPYAYCGGGPGGWGSAIVIVPYEYWKYYGDDCFIREMYPQMLRYFDFLDAHSELGLVTSDVADRWCLGDWCTPPDNSTLPTPFVNTYFYIHSMQLCIEIAKAIGKEEDIPSLEARIAPRAEMLKKFYGNSFTRDSSYCGNVQGASAFALTIGLGFEKTAEKLASYYRYLGYLDTGIFATELVIRQLFRMGEGDLALKLLTTETPHGFGKWMKEGATTLHEYWGASRSHSHPMFGAVVACFFECILGIGQEPDSAGFDRVVISPAILEGLSKASGHISVPGGRISVSYQKEGAKIRYSIEIPKGVSARAVLGGKEYDLAEGGNSFLVENTQG